MRSYARSFSGGEVTPEFYGQIADAKFQTGLALCRNFMVKPHGPLENRPGFEFVAEVRDSTEAARLIPFTYSTSQTMVLAFNDEYVRFHTLGLTLETSPGVPYEVSTVYDATEIFGVHYVQSADVLTLVNTSHAPRELRRLGALSWSFSTINFAPNVDAPTGITAVATPGASPGTPTDHTYAVTTVGAGAFEESFISSSDTCSNNLFDDGAFNTITWTGATGAQRYNVYKLSSGLWGYIGQADGLSFIDDNINPDISKTPPEANSPFTGAGNFPGAVSYYEQRRWFGGTLNKPQTLWATRSGTESNMTYSIPSRDSDALEFRVAATQANTIRHLVPLSRLIPLTSAAEWIITSVNSDAITPTSASVKPQSFVGANDAQPVVVNSNMIYAAARGGHAREIAYSRDASGYLTGDLSLRAPHLFDDQNIVDIAYQKSPYPVIWMVSSNGNLLGLTYVPEQQVGAWHQHTTDGYFESCCVVAEGDDDVLYVVVRRNVEGEDRRYVERMRPRHFDAVEDAFFVDCGLTYRGAPTLTVPAGHLIGKTIAILADGAVLTPREVPEDGIVELDFEASVVSYGIPIEADAQTLPLALEVQGYAQGKPKNVNKVFPKVFESSSIMAGPTFTELREWKQRTDEPYGTPPRLVTGEVQIDLDPGWSSEGQLCIRQKDPLPLTITAMTLDFAVGG